MTNARIPRKPLDGIRGRAVKIGAKKMLGSVPDSVEVMWHHPAAFMDMMKAGRKLDKWDKLDKNLASFATMAAAAEIGCGACLDLHYFMAHNNGLDEKKARQVPLWRESAIFTPLERRVMEYAVAMCQTPPAVTDEMSAALLADLGPAGLLELSARVGYINMAARTNVALGISSEHFSDACGLPPLAHRGDVLSGS